MNVTLRQLEAFANVELFGSFVQAANKMHVTPAALSHLIRELEKNMGFKLLERTTRSVKMTAEGEVFFSYVQRVLSAQEDAMACAKALGSGAQGIVRLATTPILASTHVVSAVTCFQESNPGIQVIIHEYLPDELVHQLEAGKVDIAIGPERAASPKTESETLFTARLTLLCPEKHELSTRSSIRWTELDDQKILLAKGGGKATISIEVDNVISLHEATEIEHFTTLLALVSIGKHVGIATSYVEPFLTIYRVKMVDLILPTVHRRVMLYTHKKENLSKATHAFNHHVKSFFEKIW